MPNKVYSLCHVHTVPAVTGLTYDFEIVEPRRRFKIKSVQWDYIIHEAPPNYNIHPIDTQTNSWICLRIGDVPPLTQMISHSFVNFTPGVEPDRVDSFSGELFRIYKPKSLHFDSWFIDRQIMFNILLYNREPVLTLMYRFTLIVEIEILSWL